MMGPRPLLGRVVLRVAVALIAAGLAGDAAAEILRLVPIDKRFEEAVALLHRGELKKADALFHEIFAQNPGETAAVLGRAQIAVSENRLTEANSAVDAVLARNPNLPEAHNMKGVVLLLQKRNDEARREFSEAVKLRPSYVTPHIYLAALTRAEGNQVRTAAAYRALASLAPRLPVGYIGEAEALMMMGKVDEAFATLERWKRADPSSVLPSHVKASVMLVHGQNRGAVQELNSALEKAPNDSATLKLLGDAHAAAGTTAQAVQHYEAALAADHRNAEAAVRLGDVRLRSGDTARAREHFRAALKADDTHPVASNNLAWLLAENRGDLDEALRLAKRATSNSVGYVDAHDTLGWVYYHRREYTKAIEALKKAQSLDRTRADVAVHLGMAYAKAGLKQQALAELRHALTSAATPLPNRAEVEALIAQLARTP